MKEFFKKLWEKIKAFAVAIWEKIKKWFINTAWPWIKKSWLQIVNVLVVLFAYGKLDDLGSPAAGLVGLWGFILLAYWIFWKFFGADKVVKGALKNTWFGKLFDPQPEPPGKE